MCFVHTLQDVTIQGDVPSPLHDKDAPYWTMYGNNPGFVPQPDSFKNISYHEVLLVDWQFNKTAWVLASQVGAVVGGRP